MSNVWTFIVENLTVLIFALVALAEVIVRLTPTEKDDSILNWIVILLNAIFPANKNRANGYHTIKRSEIHKKGSSLAD